MMKVLKIEFRFDGDRRSFEKAFEGAAGPIAQTRGLQWKIWLWNEKERIGGGMYLFDDQSSVDAYLNGPIVAGLKTASVVSEARIGVFDVVEKPTAVTRGPVGATARA
jgi:hypothetical protein